jgi:uncharacterized repeat protein (TIGR01451 family)
LTASLPAITHSYTIEGAGITIDGAGSYQAFQVASGTVVIENVNVQNAASIGGRGGDGYSGGGGGVGGGGAVYVHNGAAVTLTASSLLNNVARGGDGGLACVVGNAGGGGGGGFGGGDGGSAVTGVSTGGGGGGHSNGGTGGSNVSVDGGDGAYFGGGGGGAGINSIAPGGHGGNATPAALFLGGPESAGNGGGGAGDSQNGFAASGSGISGVPGNGGNGIGADLLFGGGGGGGAASETGFPGGMGVGAGGGGGGSNYAGGAGGVLGGGGGGGLGAAGGQGGFGAGGGGASTGGQGGGGFGAAGGNGASNPSGVAGGGGGSGLGGAIFIQGGGSLAIVDAAQISGNAAIAGVGGSSTNAADPGYVAPGNGAAMGQDIFVREQGSIVFNLTNTLSILTPIEGDETNGPDGAGGLQKIGTGTLRLNGANTYSGTTAVDQGVLDLNGSVAGSAGIGGLGTLSGNATVSGALTNSGTLSPGDGIGTLHAASLVLTPTSHVKMELAAGGTNDLVAATGTAQLAGSLEIDLDPAANVPGTHTLLTSSAISGTFSAVTFVGAVPAAYSIAYLPVGAPTSVQLIITTPPVIAIAKTADASQVLAGQTMHYTITVTNAGASDATGTTVSDAVPPGIASQTWTCTPAGGAVCGASSGTGSISDTLTAFPVNASAVYAVTAIVASAPPATITNTASAAPPAGGQCAGGSAPPCTASVSVGAIVPVSQLQLGVTANNPVLQGNGSVVYTITVTSTGTIPAAGVEIVDPLPAGITAFAWTCVASGGAVCPQASGSGAIDQVVASIPVGAALVYTVTATVAPSPPAIITNLVSVDAAAQTTCASGGAAPCTASASGSLQAIAGTPVPTMSTWLLWTLALGLLSLGAHAARRSKP